MSKLKVSKVIVGYLEENCYLLEKEEKVILIDPGDEQEKIERKLNNKKVVGILLTHSHFDHVGALSYFEEKYHLKHNKNIEYFHYEVIKTPGHTKDSLTFYFPTEKIMFTGDFLFKGTIGRMDLPGGSIKDMKESLDKIKEYSNDITIYPGHGEESNLGEEKENFKYYF